MTFIFRMGQGVHCNCFCPERWPICHVRMFATNRQLDYSWYGTINRWHCVVTHFQDGVRSVSQVFLPRKAATTWFLDFCNQLPVRLPRCNAKNCWCSGDAHFQDRAGSVSLLLLPQRAANASFMNVCNQSPLKLHEMESQTSFTLCCHSFSEWGSDCVAFSSANEGCQYVGYT